MRGLVMALCNLDVGCSRGYLCQGSWEWFFWLVHLRHSDWGNLVTSVKRPDADVLMIWFIVACSGDVNNANGWVVGAAGIRGVRVASAIVKGARIVAVVVKYVRPFADDDVDAKVRIADRGGIGVDGDGNAGSVIGAAVAVVVSIVIVVVAAAAAIVVDVFSIVVAVAAPVVIVMQGW
jgi:hypothetical protein